MKGSVKQVAPLMCFIVFRRKLENPNLVLIQTQTQTWFLFRILPTFEAPYASSRLLCASSSSLWLKAELSFFYFFFPNCPVGSGFDLLNDFYFLQPSFFRKKLFFFFLLARHLDHTIREFWLQGKEDKTLFVRWWLFPVANTPCDALPIIALQLHWAFE